MANTVSAVYALKVSATETFDTTVASNEGLAPAQNVLHSAFNINGTLDAASGVPATTVVSFTQALGAGTATIDLTSLVGTNGSAVDLSGLKIQLLMIKAPAVNANVISVEPGAANGYDFFGANMLVELAAGQQVLFFGNDAAPDVAGADLSFDLIGTGAQELDFIIVAG